MQLLYVLGWIQLERTGDAKRIRNRYLCVKRSKILKGDINVGNFEKYFIEIQNNLVFKMKYIVRIRREHLKC